MDKKENEQINKKEGKKEFKINRKLLLILIVVVILIILVILLSGNNHKVKCTQTNDINGIKNINTVEIFYKDNDINKLKTTYQYEITKKGKKETLSKIEESITSLGNAYKKINGVNFEEKKSNDKEYQAVQTIDLNKIQNDDLNKLNISKNYTKAKKSYEAAGFTCK